MLNAANRSDTEVMPLIGKIISLSSSVLLFISSDGIFAFLLRNTLEDGEIFLFFLLQIHQDSCPSRFYLFYGIFYPRRIARRGHIHIWDTEYKSHTTLFCSCKLKS